MGKWNSYRGTPNRNLEQIFITHTAHILERTEGQISGAERWIAAQLLRKICRTVHSPQYTPDEESPNYMNTNLIPIWLRRRLYENNKKKIKLYN